MPRFVTAIGEKLWPEVLTSIIRKKHFQTFFHNAKLAKVIVLFRMLSECIIGLQDYIHIHIHFCNIVLMFVTMLQLLQCYMYSSRLVCCGGFWRRLISKFYLKTKNVNPISYVQYCTIYTIALVILKVNDVISKWLRFPWRCSVWCRRLITELSTVWDLMWVAMLLQSCWKMNWKSLFRYKWTIFSISKSVIRAEIT